MTTERNPITETETRTLEELALIVAERWPELRDVCLCEGAFVERGYGDQGCSNCYKARIHLIASKVGHQSDCALHSEPAYPAGACNCGCRVCQRNGWLPTLDLSRILVAIREHGGEYSLSNRKPGDIASVWLEKFYGEVDRKEGLRDTHAIVLAVVRALEGNDD